MKPLLFFSLFAFLFAIIDHPDYQLEPLPRLDTGPLITGVDIRYGFDVVKNKVFAADFRQQRRTYDGKFLLPTGVQYQKQESCIFNDQTTTSYTMEEYKEEISKSFSIGFKFQEFGLTLSESYQRSIMHLKSSQRVISHSKASCTVYNLIAIPGLMPFDQYFVEAIDRLPNVYNTETDPIFRHFFDEYGTHIPTHTLNGGYLEKYSYTNYDYAKTVSKQKIEQQASALFFIEIDAKSSRSIEITREFNQSTQAYSTTGYGGKPWEAGNGWGEWATAVQADPNYPVVVELVPIGDLCTAEWAPDHPTWPAKQQAILDATAAYMKKEGCTDPRAENWDKTATVDDGKCVIKTLEASGTGWAECPWGNTVGQFCSDCGHCAGNKNYCVGFADWAQLHCRVPGNCHLTESKAGLKAYTLNVCQEESIAWDMKVECPAYTP